VDELNGYLLGRTGGTFGTAELGKVVDDTGKWRVNEDHLGVAMINLEEERTLKTQMPETTLVNGRTVALQPDLKLNLHVLFAANFKQYDVGLRYLSQVLTFFQANPSFTQSDHPSLDARIARLTAELLSLTYEQLNSVWTYIGAKQLPSAIYRLRLVAIQDQEAVTIAKPLSTIATTVHAA
jgi:hypothetical protein